jgi:hypothetical protein
MTMENGILEKVDAIYNKVVEGKELTEEQKNEIVEALEQMDQSPQTQAMRNVLSGVVDREPVELEEGQGYVTTNDQGQLVKVEAPEYKSDSLTDIMAGSTDDKTAESLKKAIGTYNLSDSDILETLTIVNRYKSGEKFSIYNALPDSLKRLVNINCGSGNKQHRQLYAKMLIEAFIADANLEKEFVDFNTSLQKELDIPSLMDMYNDHIKEVMETKLLEKAAAMEEKDPNAAKLLRDVSAAFTDSYTYKKLVEYLENNKKFTKKISREVDKYNRYCNDLNYMSSKSEFVINDVSLMLPVLDKVLPETLDIDGDIFLITNVNIKKFIVAFCSSCAFMDKTNTVHNAYIYYFIKNILTLEYSEVEKNEFAQTIINNIVETMKTILKMEKEYNRG